MHDPTTKDRQGPDVGSRAFVRLGYWLPIVILRTEYRSAIFTTSDEQQRIANEVKDEVNEKHWKGRIVTTIAPASTTTWWDAEAYHQCVRSSHCCPWLIGGRRYLDNNPSGYACASRLSLLTTRR